MSVPIRTIRAILLLPILGLAFLVAPPARSIAHAATITAPALHAKAYVANTRSDGFWPSDPVLCDIILDGVIAAGDAKSVEQAFAGIVGTVSPITAFPFFLCLRSDGGDTREAVAIAQFLLNLEGPTIATVVEDGRTCASACAVIFLAGRAPAARGAWPQRFLHPRGRLMFHSFYLNLTSFSDDGLRKYLDNQATDPRSFKEKIADLYADGLRDAQSVIATYQKLITQREDIGDHWVRPSLFLEMLAQGPEEWLCVDTVDAVGRWNIQVFGYQPPKPPKKEHYVNLCRAAYHWRSDAFAVGADYDLEDDGEMKRPAPSQPLAGRNKSNADFDDRVTLPVHARSAPLTCVADVTYGRDYVADARRKQVVDQSKLTALFLPRNSGPAGAIIELSPAAYYPAATLLRDLPGLRAPPDWAAPKTQPAVAIVDHPGQMMNGCAYRSMAKTDRDACAAACATDAACQGYSHNTVTRTCELKHTLTALRRDPLWTSGVPSRGPAPGRSVRADTMVAYPPNIDDAVGFRLVGKLIDDAKAEDKERCSDRCRTDRACVALEYGETSQACRRFSEVTGSRTAPPRAPRAPTADEEVFTVEIKKQ